MCVVRTPATGGYWQQRRAVAHARSVVACCGVPVRSVRLVAPGGCASARMPSLWLQPLVRAALRRSALSSISARVPRPSSPQGPQLVLARTFFAQAFVIKLELHFDMLGPALVLGAKACESSPRKTCTDAGKAHKAHTRHTAHSGHAVSSHDQQAQGCREALSCAPRRRTRAALQPIAPSPGNRSARAVRAVRVGA